MVFGGEGVVARVVGGDGHDGTSAVAHEDVVGYPEGNGSSGDGVKGMRAEGDAGFFFGEVGAFQVGLAGASFAVGGDGRALVRGGELINKGVFGGEDHVSDAKERVGTGGEDGEGVAAGEGEVDVGALAAANPVALEEFDGFGPVELIEVAQKAFGVGGDAEHPLFEGAADDFVAFGAPFFDFFVGEDGAEVGGPVDGGFGNVSKAAGVDFLTGEAGLLEFGDGAGALGFFAEVGVVDLEEDPLGPADVGGVGGVDFAVPIVGEAEGLELGAEGGDVVFGGDAGVLASLDGVLLGGQAKGVPAHGVEDVFAEHAMVAGKDVGGGVAFGVADVEASSGGVGEHVEDVVFWVGRVEARVAWAGGAKCGVLLPVGLPFGFDGREGVGAAGRDVWRGVL